MKNLLITIILMLSNINSNAQKIIITQINKNKLILKAHNNSNYSLVLFKNGTIIYNQNFIGKRTYYINKKNYYLTKKHDKINKAVLIFFSKKNNLTKEINNFKNDLYYNEIEYIMNRDSFGDINREELRTDRNKN